jgi:uncharacterized protein YggE
MKSKLYWFLTILVAAALLTGCASTAFAQTATPPTPQTVNRTLSVNGSGKVFLTPDIAYITIGVHTEGATATEAVSDNNEQTQAVISALQSAGIAEKDMQTNNFSIYPQQQYDDQGKPTGEVRYSVDNSVMVTVRNIDTIGDVLDTVVTAGANAINGIQFDVENKTAALTEARKAAVADARTKAQELAEAAGVELGDVQSISEYTSGGPQPMYDMRAAAPAAEMASSVPVQPGQMLVTLEVSVSFSIR